MKKMNVITTWVVVAAVTAPLVATMLYFLIGGIYGKYVVTQELKLRNNAEVWQTKQFEGLEISFPKYWGYNLASLSDRSIATAIISSPTVLGLSPSKYYLSIKHFSTIDRYLAETENQSSDCEEDDDGCRELQADFDALKEDITKSDSDEGVLERLVVLTGEDSQEVEFAGKHAVMSSVVRFEIVYCSVYLLMDDGLYKIEYSYEQDNSEEKGLYDKITSFVKKTA